MGYFGCRGSQPHSRGYTCALWQVFHALLVNAESKEFMNKKKRPHAGLAAVHGYVEGFFACEECRLHFIDMAENMAWRKVATDDDAILWLWRAHNAVNRRLAGDSIEDPAWPKQQFPPPNVCYGCWGDGPNGESVLQESAVLQYLRRFYAPESHWSEPEEIPRAAQPHSIIWPWALVAFAVCVLVYLSGVCHPERRGRLGSDPRLYVQQLAMRFTGEERKRELSPPNSSFG